MSNLIARVTHQKLCISEKFILPLACMVAFMTTQIIKLDCVMHNWSDFNRNQTLEVFIYHSDTNTRVCTGLKST